MNSRFLRSIKFKIFLAFALCIAIMFALGGAGIYSLSRSNGNLKDVYESNVLPILDISSVLADELDVRIRIRNLAVEQDATKAANLTARIKADEQDASQHWTAYYPGNVSSGDEKAVADRIDQLMKQTDNSVAGIMANPSTFESVASGTMRDAYDALIVNLRNDVTLNANQAKDANQRGEQAYTTTLWVLGLLLVCGVLLGTGILMFLVRAISTPLGKALLIANEIAGGQLDNEIRITETDEFGELLNSLKKMDNSLANTVREIKTSTESIAVAAGEIAQGNQDLSKRTEMQASSLEETAASMEELTSTVKQNTENARQAVQLAISATETAVRGGTVVSEVIETMSGISSSSSSIVEIISVIEGIAFQTNILALNAAVEAARAGEQGRGFAVVAGEVRVLAQRSAAAAKEIKSLIETSVAKVQVGSNLVSRAGQTMDEIVVAVKRVTDVMNEISSASVEQSTGIEQINQAVNQMDEITQQNAALVEQAAAAASSMEEQGHHLSETVSVFRLKGASTHSASHLPAPSRPALKRPDLARSAVKRADVKRPDPKSRAEGGTAPPTPVRPMAKPVGVPADDDWTAF